MPTNKDGTTTQEPNDIVYGLDSAVIKSSGSTNENLIKTNVTLSSSSTTSVTFTDSSILTTTDIEVYTTQDIPHTSISVSNGSCTVVFPKQSETVTIDIFLKLIDKYIKSTNLSELGNATAAQVYEGYTFSSADGILLTGTASSNSGPIVEIGTSVYGDITGSQTANNYEFKVCYVSSSEICLIGQTSLVGSATHSTARGYTWTATFAADALWSGSPAKTITGVKIPTITQIREKCCGWYLDAQTSRDLRYWTYSYFYSSSSNKYMSDTISNSNAWHVHNIGSVTINDVSNSDGVVPYIVIPL